MKHWPIKCWLAYAMTAGVALGGAWPAQAAGLADPLERPATMRRTPERSAMLDVTQVDKRLVAVGERGLILLSGDDGRTWRQAPAPASVTLTAIRFPTPRRGWAVGHAGVVLRSDDGGETWRRSLDGRKAARLALDEAQALPNNDPASATARRKADLLLADGPDKPFFSLHFSDENTGFVVGAFGLVFKTVDGGATWKAWMTHIDNPDGLHIYSVHAGGGRIYMAGERGLVLVSTDGGERFEKMELPYEGTFFSLAVTETGRLAVGGLRGNVFIADPGPVNPADTVWRRVESLPDASINAMAWLNDHRLLLANQAGRLFAAEFDEARATTLPSPPSPPISGMTPTADAGLLTAGMAGLVSVAARTIENPGESPGKTGKGN